MSGMRIVILGLSLSSSWGNGHATTWRALIRGLAARGHHVTFLERDQPWYADHRDLAEPDYCQLILYDSLDALAPFAEAIRDADAVIVGSYVPDGIAVGKMVQDNGRGVRSEEHTSELQSLMRISYAVFCLKKKKTEKTACTHSPT